MAKGLDLTSKVSIKETIDYIINTYHRPLQKTLKKLEPLIHNMDIDYGEEHPEILQISELFCQFRREILKHLGKEEGITFPAMIQFEKLSKKSKVFASLESIEKIQELVHGTKMLNEHDEFDSYLSALISMLESDSLDEKEVEGLGKIRKIVEQLRLDTIDHANLEDTVLYKEGVEVQEILKTKIEEGKKALIA